MRAPIWGVMNIGNRPTVSGQSLSVEVHLLNWSDDLYNQVLTVSLESFIRAEQKFDSLDQLKAQIAVDCEQVNAKISAAKISETSEAVISETKVLT